MSKPASSGIQTIEGGVAFIPASKRADGTTRKEIKVRPGYKPPEDVETYRSRNTDTWRNRSGRVPGVDVSQSNQPQQEESRSKNAKRRETARAKKELEAQHDDTSLEGAVANLEMRDDLETTGETDQEAERQKKIRNQLKKLRAVRDLKSKKSAGGRMSADQLIKISKEQEIVREIVKLKYDGPELDETPAKTTNQQGPV